MRTASAQPYHPQTQRNPKLTAKGRATRRLRPWGSLGFANAIGVLCLIPTTLLAAPWGVALAHRLEQRWLRVAFAGFLAATGLKMTLSLLGV